MEKENGLEKFVPSYQAEVKDRKKIWEEKVQGQCVGNALLVKLTRTVEQGEVERRQT